MQLEDFTSHIQSHLMNIFTVFADSINVKEAPTIDDAFVEDVNPDSDTDGSEVDFSSSDSLQLDNSERVASTVDDSFILTHNKMFKCNECDREFPSKSKFDVHKTTHSDLANFQCSLCPKVFKHIYHMRHHQKSHLRNGEQLELTPIVSRLVNCIHCEFRTHKICLLQQHSIDRHGGNLTCMTCKQMFVDDDARRQHMQDTHKKCFQCVDCHRMYPTLRQLKCHMITHTNPEEKRHECGICAITFKYRHSLVSHEKKQHQIKKATTPTAAAEYKCIFCDFTSASRRKFAEHATEQHDGDFTCSQCGQMFPDAAARRQHMATHEKQFQCDECGYLCITISKLEIHMRTHTEEAKYKCNACPKAFKHSPSLTYHRQKYHAELAPYKCDQCNTVFFTRGHFNLHRTSTDCAKHANGFRCTVCDAVKPTARILTQHMRKHTGSRHHCPECGLECMSKAALNIHMKSHSDDRPFRCDLCPKAFKVNGNLLAHKRRHESTTTEIRFVTCDICKINVREAYLATHMRRHTENLLKCIQCNQKFVLPHQLKKHMLVHSEQRDFQCDLCPKMFKAKHTLVAHRRIHLGDFLYTCQWCGKGFHDNRNYKKHTLAEHGRQSNEQSQEGGSLITNFDSK